VFYVKDLLEQEFGVDRVERGGLKVTTTIDYSIQKIVEDEVSKGIKQYGQTWDIANGGVHNGASVVIDPRTNEILSMVGSVDYWNDEDPRIDGKVNVTISSRQMGSSVKPYTYLTAIHQGYGPWLLTPDVANFRFGNYDPPNWDLRNWGSMLAQKALPQSRNVPAVYTLQLAGIENVMETMQKVGITTLRDPSQYGLSLTLGTAEMKLLEHAGGYTVFANDGIKKPIVSILKVEDAEGNVLKEFEKPEEKRVFSEQEIYALNYMLCDLGSVKSRSYFAPMYHINGVPICGKTGTTNGPRDLVAFLYHKNLLVSVWSGNNNNAETPGAWSTTVPLPIAHNIMQRLSDKYTPVTPSRPGGIYATSVCEDTGRMASADTACKKVPTIYIAGHPPAPDTRKTIKICKDSGKISTNVEEAEKYDLLEDAILLEGYNLENKYQDKAYKDFLSALSSKKDNVKKYFFKKPDEADCKLPLGPDDSPFVELVSPADGVTVSQGGDLDVHVKFRVLHSATTMSVMLDGTQLTFVDDPDEESTFTVTIPADTIAGDHMLVVIVTDSDGKTGSTDVSITVTAVVIPITIDITEPADGDSFSALPIDIGAVVSNGTVDKVVFKINGPDGYYKAYTDVDGTDGWAVSWDDTALDDGSYTISTTGISGTDIIDGASIVILLDTSTP
jgi:membrane carboxypeptidase/penicillin-binding protein PbpC